MTTTVVKMTPHKDIDIEVLVSSVLITGVVVSMALILLGLIWHYLITATLNISYKLPMENFFSLFVATFREVFISGLNPSISVTLGIIVLMLTPYIRILSSVIYFAVVEKNVKYTVFTMFVLSALSYSLFLR